MADDGIIEIDQIVPFSDLCFLSSVLFFYQDVIFLVIIFSCSVMITLIVIY